FKKDTEIDIKNSTKTNEQNIFKDVRIGNHDGYYRVVVELDGYYRYDFKKISNGYQIELK
ncbi:MAG: AMIN domain-containing protein, partial [Sulfurimonas sp.]|nr:AMIN domain-containing protein [Sulfurimonas sp.]